MPRHRAMFRFSPRLPRRGMAGSALTDMTSPGPRKGAVSPWLLMFVASMVALLLLGWSALNLRPESRKAVPAEQPLRVYCAAGVAQPVRDVIGRYLQEPFGRPVELVRIGGSGELLGQIKIEDESGTVGGGEIFVTADAQLLQIAHQHGLVAEVFSLAKQIPVIAVGSESSLAFKDLPDLLARDDLKFAIASKCAAVGKLVREIALREGLLDQLEARKATECENVMTLAQALASGSLDAAVIWDTTVVQVNRSRQDQGQDPILRISCPADGSGESGSDIAAGVVASTERPAACLKFLRYLTAPEKGRPEFEKYGFSFMSGYSPASENE